MRGPSVNAESEWPAVREKARREARATAWAVWVIVFFIAVVPLAIEIISLGVSWLGYILSAISILKGIYEAGNRFGWIKPSRQEKSEEEEKTKMNHYYYHCERNPEGFNRLKFENFDREAIERTHKEAEKLIR